MEKEDYYNLLIRFFAGEISDEEMTVLRSWIEKDPGNRNTFDQENEIWQEASIRTKLENYKTDQAWINISKRLRLGKKNNRSVTIIRKTNFRILLIAASLAILIAVGSLSLWFLQKQYSGKLASSSVIISTKEGEKAHIFLADSTEVILNSESTLQYNNQYNLKNRTIKFTGEAYFNVRTNPQKPFIVKLDKMEVLATGTRFNVFSFGNEDRIETTLEEGTIKISIKSKEPVTLRSGEQAVYFVNSKKILVRDVVPDTYTSWKENKLRFNDTPFEEVLRRIGRKYNVNFEITSHDLLGLKYTATFIDEPINEVMQMLEAVSPITYKIYYRTKINDKQYLKPRIVVGKRKI